MILQVGTEGAYEIKHTYCCK